MKRASCCLFVLLSVPASGFGAVVSGVRRADGQAVAIKVVPHASTKQVRENSWEVGLLAAAQHENVVGACSAGNVRPFSRRCSVSRGAGLQGPGVAGHGAARGRLAGRRRGHLRWLSRAARRLHGSARAARSGVSARAQLRAPRPEERQPHVHDRRVREDHRLWPVSRRVALARLHHAGLALLDATGNAAVRSSIRRRRLLTACRYLPHSQPADIWSFAISMLEMINGHPPNHKSPVKALFTTATKGMGMKANRKFSLKNFFFLNNRYFTMDVFNANDRFSF